MACMAIPDFVPIWPSKPGSNGRTTITRNRDFLLKNT
jgi:hypothetical protein